TTTAVTNPYFHVAIIPYKSGSGNATPSYTTTAITNGSIVSLVWSNGYTDYSIFKYQNNVQTSGQGVVTDAKLSSIRLVTSSGTAPATLTINQASTFKFGTAIGITVNGKLVTNGTSTQRITFTSSKTTPIAGDWIGIVLTGGPNTITYSDVSYAQYGLKVNSIS